MNRSLKILIGTLVAIVVVLGCAEFGTRAYLSNRVTNQIATDAEATGNPLPSKAKAQFDSSPVLLGLLGDKINSMDLFIPSSLSTTYEDNNRSRPIVTGQPEIHVTAQHITGLRGGNSEKYIVGDLQAEAIIPPDMLLSEIRKATSSSSSDTDGLPHLLQGIVNITNVTPHIENQTLELELNGGLATISVIPTVSPEGRILLDIQNAQVMGINLPPQFLRSVENALANNINAVDLGGLHITELSVSSAGLNAKVRGINVHIHDLTEFLRNR